MKNYRENSSSGKQAWLQKGSTEEVFLEELTELFCILICGGGYTTLTKHLSKLVNLYTKKNTLLYTNQKEEREGGKKEVTKGSSSAIYCLKKIYTHTHNHFLIQ